MSRTGIHDDEDEEWIFSLNLPFPTNRVLKLVTNHRTEEVSEKAPTETDRDEDEGIEQEMKSLLEDDDDDDQEAFCWQFQSPKGRTFKSNILLQLSYRPSWQGTPEYTSTVGQSRLGRLASCCGCRGPKKYIIEPEQIWEVYSTKDIVDVVRRYVTIRGIGKCQAVSVYMKPLYQVAASTTNSTSDEEGKIPPRYEEAWKSSLPRMGQGFPEASSEEVWSRFTETEDTLPPIDNKRIVITYAVPLKTESKYDPPLLWKVQLPPLEGEGSASAVMMDTITVFDGSVDLREPATHMYINGYQSWSFAGSLWKGQPQPQPALPNVFTKAFHRGGDLPAEATTVFSSSNRMTAHSKATPSFYKSDFYTCVSTGRGQLMDENGGPALLCGWISQHEQLGVVGMDANLSKVSMHATHQAQLYNRGIQTDWAYGQLVSPHHYDEEPMVHFLHDCAAYNQARPLQNGPLLTGWCSWYHYYERISAANLRTNFSKLAGLRNKVPTNVAVVDDGYMTAWGDWDSLKPTKFEGMDNVSRDIQSHGMRPGLWLAPFACDRGSKIAKEHPEWIIRNDNGIPANSSFCGKFFYGLDATNPKVRGHVRGFVRRAVVDWGFQVLKIDFLYAACLEGNGKYDPTMTRAQAMHLALQTIREAAGPDVFLIGCGCPLAAGIGYADGMRISADTGPTWLPALPLPWWDHSSLPALRSMIRNSMTRAPLGHRWWHNDPDCLLLGETTSLTNEEVASAASVVAMTCGMMLLSDDLTKVSIPRMRILTKIFPMTGVSATVLDLHTATANCSLPSIMRVWCTDRYNALEDFRESDFFRKSMTEFKENAEATHFGRLASFNFDEPLPHPNERKRSCISVARGLGTWTVISLSNWKNHPRVMEIPHLAVEPPPESGWGVSTSSLPPAPEGHKGADVGYHIFSFWSGKYTWVSLEDTHHRNDEADEAVAALRRTLGPHETEIFHIRPVTPNLPQYVGSDIHFSCGHEVSSFTIHPDPKHQVDIQLKSNLNRVGHIYIYVPVVDTSHVQMTMGGRTPVRWTVVGNVPSTLPGGSIGASQCIGRILRIMVVVHGDGSEGDGLVTVEY